MSPPRPPLLSVQNLAVEFLLPDRSRRRAVDGVSLQIDSGTTLGLLGESGSGKTTLARAIVRLIHPASGSITFGGREITHLSQRKLRPIRKMMQIVFQDSAGSLNPRMTVGDIVAEPLIVHRVDVRLSRRTAVLDLLDRVGLPKTAIDRYPHEFSGGQRQRINIARAVALHPRLLVCDEPVSALDVSVRAQILNLFRDLQRELGLTYLFVSHDLAVVRYMSDQVAVMHAGRIVESGEAEKIYARPRHPYTAELLAASTH